MRTDCSQDSFDFGTVEGHRVVGAFDGGQITSHAGGLLLGASNRAIRLIERLARCFKDGRDPDALLHTVPALIGQRIFAIALGYEDINDHDHLRHDPVLQVLAGKLTCQAVELCGAGRQVDAQPAGARCQGRQRSLSQDHLRRGGDCGAVRDAVCGVLR